MTIVERKNVTGSARIQRTDVIRTRLISILMPAKMQRLEVVRAHFEFLSHFSVPQANPTQPVIVYGSALVGEAVLLAVICMGE